MSLRLLTRRRLSSLRYYILQVIFVLVVFSIARADNATEKPPPTITRTQIKVSRSLNPEDMQTVNVMTKDGNVAQLIVKRRDSKSTPNNPQFSRAASANWIPASSFYYHPNIIRLEKIARVRNASEKQSNVIDSDR